MWFAGGNETLNLLGILTNLHTATGSGFLFIVDFGLKRARNFKQFLRFPSLMSRRQCCLFRVPGVAAKETGAHDKLLEKTDCSNRAWLLHKPFGTRVGCSRGTLEKARGRGRLPYMFSLLIILTKEISPECLRKKSIKVVDLS